MIVSSVSPFFKHDTTIACFQAGGNTPVTTKMFMIRAKHNATCYATLTNCNEISPHPGYYLVDPLHSKQY